MRVDLKNNQNQHGQEAKVKVMVQDVACKLYVGWVENTWVKTEKEARDFLPQCHRLLRATPNLWRGDRPHLCRSSSSTWIPFHESGDLLTAAAHLFAFASGGFKLF